jgi:hypothetical protein
MSYLEALGAARAGRLEAAATLSRHAIDLAQQAEHQEAAAIYEAGGAAWYAFSGDAPAARQRAAAALRFSKGRDGEYAAAVALALAGDVVRSQSLAADLEKRYPEDTSVQTSYLPTLRALASLHADQPLQAIEQLQITRRYELAYPALSFFAFFGSLYPVFVRGEAYLAAHKSAEAAVEFQRILGHRGLVLADPMGARARVELGRAWAASGDTVKARAAYNDFLTLWKNADRDIPILRQATAEYAKLQ